MRERLRGCVRNLVCGCVVPPACLAPIVLDGPSTAHTAVWTGLSALGCAALNKTEVADTDGRLQVESTRIQGQAIASYLKFKIMSGWDDFASVHHIALQGRPK